jgi:hypothetical protein
MVKVIDLSTDGRTAPAVAGQPSSRKPKLPQADQEESSRETMSEVNSEHNEQLVCPGFARDTGQASLQRVTFAANDVAEIKGAGDSRANPQVHDTVAGWTLMGTFERAGRPIAVLEEIGLQESRIAFVDAETACRAQPECA